MVASIIMCVLLITYTFYPLSGFRETPSVIACGDATSLHEGGFQAPSLRELSRRNRD